MKDIEYTSDCKVQLIAHTTDPVKVVAAAAKLCYSNVDPMKLYDDLTEENAIKFITMLSTLGHGSPFEHASFTFAIDGVSRSLLAQITRHRVASFSVRSQRYVDNKAGFKPVIPKAISMNDLAMDIFNESMQRDLVDYTRLEHALLIPILVDQYADICSKKWFENFPALGELYEDELPNKDADGYINSEDGFCEACSKKYVDMMLTYVDPGVDENGDFLVPLTFYGNPAEMKEFKKNYTKARRTAGENARAVFPNACNTAMVLSMNARELSHFFHVRCCNRAQEEIRVLAWRMFWLVDEIAHPLFANAGPACLHGKCSEGSMSCGHPYSMEGLNDE